MASNGRHDAAPGARRDAWDDLGRSQPDLPGERDVTLAAVVDELQARDDAPGADPRFAARLYADLERTMNTMRRNAAFTASAPPPRVVLEPAGSLSPVRWPSRQDGPWRWRSAPYLATAALLLLTLVSALVSIRPPEPTVNDGQRPQVPAMGAPATPDTSSVAEQTLARFTLPAGSLASEAYAGLSHYIIPPENASTWKPAGGTTARGQGPRLTYVLSGSFTIASEGPVQVQRAATTTWEEMPPGSEVTLGPGDAMVSELGDAFAATNSDPTPVSMLDGTIINLRPNTDPKPPAWYYQNQDAIMNLTSMPSGSATLHLRALTLAPGATLPPPPGAVLQLAVSPAADAIISTRGNFEKRNVGAEPLLVYVLTLEPAADTAASATPGA